MTIALAALYLASLSCELGGLALIIRQFRKARRRWSEHADDVAREHETMNADLRFRLDPMISRYGVTPGEIRRATVAIESLMAPDTREELLAVALLTGGILLSAVANLLTL